MASAKKTTAKKATAKKASAKKTTAKKATARRRTILAPAKKGSRTAKAFRSAAKKAMKAL